MIKKTNKNSNRKRLTKGGRVKAAKGFPNPTKEPMEKKPIRKPIPQRTQKLTDYGFFLQHTFSRIFSICFHFFFLYYHRCDTIKFACSFSMKK